VARWVEDVKNNSNKDVAIVMVGSKVDLIRERVVDRNEALKLSREFEILYIEASAKTHENV
jgi:Ras-related protein Rab-6A